MCTFNPIYGQGMTHASRQARELKKIFAENSYKLQDISHIYNRRAASITDECWLASTTNDWKKPTLKVIETDKNGVIKTSYRGDHSAANKNCEARIPIMIQFFHWYNHWLLKCASKSEELSSELFHVLNQHSSPLVLVKPKTILTVFYTALMHSFFHRKN